jgi:hypothetical protein
MAFRAIWNILKLSMATLALVAVWAVLNVDALQRLDERYRQRNDYRRRLDEAEREIIRLKEERLALARGGFPAEKVLRERYMFGRPGEKAILLEAAPPTTAPRKLDSAAIPRAEPRPSWPSSETESLQAPVAMALSPSPLTTTNPSPSGRAWAPR